MVKGKSYTDLSESFDCSVHHFLIAKLETYGFLYEALMQSYAQLQRGNIELK